MEITDIKIGHLYVHKRIPNKYVCIEDLEVDGSVIYVYYYLLDGPDIGKRTAHHSSFISGYEKLYEPYTNWSNI